MRIRPSHVTEARFKGSNERIVGASGELNAGSRSELISRLAELASMIAAGDVAPFTAEEAETASVAERRAAVTGAFHDREGSDWAELGASLSGEITTRVEREGFMRTILEKNDLQQGNLPRIRIREPNVRAVLSRGVAQTFAQYVRDKFITADEFAIVSNPHVSEIDLNQGTSDILEDKYFEGLEAILVQEDRTVKKLLDTTVGLYNDVTYFATGLTPATIGAAKTSLEQWRLPALNFLFAIDLLNDISVGTSFSTYFDPISKYEIVMTGRIGSLFGMTMITDGYRDPQLQVLEQGEFYITSSPNLLGGYTDRGPVKSVPSDQANQGILARGWYLSEIVSMAIGNAKAVVKGTRL